MSTENSKTREPHKFVLNFSQSLDLQMSNNNDALQNSPIYYTWKNIRQQYRNNKLKIIAPSQNDGFELPDGSCSVSEIQDYIQCVMKKHDTLPTIRHIHVNNLY